MPSSFDYFIGFIDRMDKDQALRTTRVQLTTSLKMAKTTTGSNGLINPIHSKPLHLVEPQPVRSGYEPKHSIVYTRV